MSVPIYKTEQNGKGITKTTHGNYVSFGGAV
jgi:hypothetical protein